MDEATGVREVIALFNVYVQNAAQPGGPTELAGALKRWNRKRKRARRMRPHYGETMEVCGQVFYDVQTMCAHYGMEARVRDAVLPDGGLGFGSDRWAVHDVIRPGDGVRVVTLWNRDQWGVDSMKQGQCVSGRLTWSEAMAEAASDFSDYRAMVVRVDDRLEEAALRAGIIRHVLDLDDEGRLPLVQTEGPSLRPEIRADKHAFELFATQIRDDYSLTWRGAYDEAERQAGGSAYSDFEHFDKGRSARLHRAKRKRANGRGASESE